MEEEANKETEKKLEEIQKVGKDKGNKVVNDLLFAVIDVKPEPPSKSWATDASRYALTITLFLIAQSTVWFTILQYSGFNRSDSASRENSRPNGTGFPIQNAMSISCLLPCHTFIFTLNQHYLHSF